MQQFAWYFLYTFELFTFVRYETSTKYECYTNYRAINYVSGQTKTDVSETSCVCLLLVFEKRLSPVMLTVTC
jgi:hypothetical protein